MKQQAWVNVLFAAGALGFAFYLGDTAFAQIKHYKGLAVYAPLIALSVVFVAGAGVFAWMAFLFFLRAVSRIERGVDGLLLITYSGHRVSASGSPRVIKEIGDVIEINASSKYTIFSLSKRTWVCRSSDFTPKEKS
ncbi:hypothetical protein LBW56_14635 [Ralstonia solanacearum]|uniref:hypothetical protein n=1 Tax=Ralstonia solanacearum TaxID=305 RepID=UPI001FFAA4D6|nr:hypothetical protein [Ralstonia solanacearum]MDB0527930.1 hypothetical protein [Ralstonia solanacearum]